MLKTKLVHTTFIHGKVSEWQALDVKEYHGALDKLDVGKKTPSEAEVTWSTSRPI